MLHWFSKFKCRVQTKGGYTALAARRFIVTSNFKITELFTSQQDAMVRRFQEFDITEGTEAINTALREFEAASTFPVDNPISVHSQSSVWGTIEDDQETVIDYSQDTADSDVSTVDSLNIMAMPID